MREQDPNPDQDWSQLEDAFPVSACRLLHPEGARRPRHAEYGPRAHPPVGLAILQADRGRCDPLPERHEPRGGPGHSQPLPLHPAVGKRVRRLPESLGRIRAQAAGGERAEPAAHPRGSRGLVGPGYSADQHAVPERPAHARLRQGVAHAHGVQAVYAYAPEPLLVDPPTPRRQAVEPEQLPHGHDPGAWRRGGHPGAHALQGHVLPYLGGALLGEGLRLRGVHEVQETHQRPAGGSQPDPQPALHALVVADHQPRQRLRWLPGPA
mmetsp:Transcript_13659/g.18094  ORF Transcript_13659/g.18094 Transcript_13659/m.18094 type:complete len:266 (+) Transcript_13659:4972-5769(+)